MFFEIYKQLTINSNFKYSGIPLHITVVPTVILRGTTPEKAKNSEKVKVMT